MSPSNTEFSESQADVILRLAIDLKARRETSGNSTQNTPRVSLDQLYKSAAEIGIEVEVVRKAAEQVVGRKAILRSKDSKLPTILEKQIGATIVEADYPRLLEHLRSFTNSAGTAQVIGGTLEWIFVDVKSYQMLHVVVIPSPESTLLRVRITNLFSSFPIKKSATLVPLSALVIACIATFSFFGSRSHWLDLAPLLVAALFCIAAVSYVPTPFRKRKTRDYDGQELIHSLGEWIHLESNRRG